MWIALGLIVLFYILDSYYLGLERKFIAVEKSFVKAAKEKKEGELAEGIYAFNIKAVKDDYATICSALCSASTAPFYIILFLIVLAVCLWLFLY